MRLNLVSVNETGLNFNAWMHNCQHKMKIIFNFHNDPIPFIFHDDLSITYLVPSDDAANEVLETAFGDKAVYDGISYRLEPGISRKQVLVPAITAIFGVLSA